ncbi:hypothetical protein DPMN_016601 [Dreissena polymorpha]|uniref:Uncharacterized protein n=1 Tax=Dreissena polymorpha TaxID=45954 RepID=A0A9D4S6P7_DREPO|nr:hypothetical protein DPMN_016601 [Dreissena polymorpha]
MRTALQVSLKIDVDNCNRLKDELKQLRDAVLELADRGKVQPSFIIALQASLKIDVDNCNKLKGSLKQLSDAVQALAYRGKAELSFKVERKGLDKILESEVFLKENTVQVDSTISFLANTEIEQFLTKQLSLGKFLKRTQSLAVLQDPEHVFTVKQKREYDVRIPSDKSRSSFITGICVISDDKILVADHFQARLKLLALSVREPNFKGLCKQFGSR